jgi:hypothetical protein
MIEGLTEMGRLSLINGLAPVLKDVEWGSPAMAKVIHTYYKVLGKTAAAALLVRLSPLTDFGLDSTGGAAAAMQLAALKNTDEAKLAAVYREAWATANGEDPPEGVGYQSFGGEVALEVVRRFDLNKLIPKRKTKNG